MKRRVDPLMPNLVPALALGIVPHVMDLSPWITVCCFSCWAYLWFGAGRSWPLPPRWLTAVLAFAAFSGIVAGSRGTFNSDSGIGLLCLSAALKPLEIKKHRDRMITLFLSYFMVVAALFFSSSLEMTVYLYFSVIGITACLVRVNHPGIFHSKALKLALTITVQALPLSLILFFVFPRIQGSLWGVQAGSGITGLSNTLSPGAISRLGQSNETALRVTFEGQAPPISDRYFRAYVFQNFDGKTWRVSWLIPQWTDQVSGDEPGVRCTVTLEPHQQNYLVVPDYPQEAPKGYTLAQDLTVQSLDQVTKTIQYSLTFFKAPKVSAFKDWEAMYTTLPSSGNPRTHALAEEFRKNAGSVEDLIRRVLDFFHHEAFYYTLSPPEPGENSVDGFLFDTRRGYCEHYASAFVFIMRASGVPARVVGGYCGGEMNPYGGYLMIRQKDAHAWAEVFDEGKGWVRVDPTSAVAAERVETDAARAAAGTGGVVRENDRGFLGGMVMNVRYVWDALNHQWYSTIIGYSQSGQRRFLEKLGLSLDSAAGMVKTLLMTLVSMAALMALYYLRLQWVTEGKLDPVRKGYLRFLKKMEKAGVVCPTHLGPLDFAEKAVSERKDLEKDIRGITALYVLLRYAGQEGDDGLIHDFLVQVGHFRPSKKQEPDHGVKPVNLNS